jgi:hypothetical protein
MPLQLKDKVIQHLKDNIFCVVTLCSPVEFHRRFRGINFLYFCGEEAAKQAARNKQQRRT